MQLVNCEAVDLRSHDHSVRSALCAPTAKVVFAAYAFDRLLMTDQISKMRAPKDGDEESTTANGSELLC